MRKWYLIWLLLPACILGCTTAESNHGATAKARLLCNYEDSLTYSNSPNAVVQTGRRPDPDEGELAIVRALVEVTQLVPNFVVQEDDVSTAAALIQDNARFILFRKGFARQLQEQTGSKWAPYCVFAHEIGHHLLGHTLLTTGSRKALELDADRWAGSMLARLGVPLRESQLALQSLSSINGTERHPQLSERLKASEQGWKLHVTTPRDKRVLKIAIILNGANYYTQEIMASLTSELDSLLRGTEYTAHFEFIVGSPNSADSKENELAFSQLFGRFDSDPDFLITIGTQVSEYAYRHYYGRLPMVFVGVSDPIRSKLVKSLNPDPTRGNIAGVSYGIDAHSYMGFFANTFPGNRFGFLYNEAFTQDLALRDAILDAAARHQPPIPVEAIAVTSPALSPEQLAKADIFFGRFYVMNNLVEFIQKNPKPFVAADVSNLYKGALAAIASDSHELGSIAAREILAPAILRGTSLSKLQVFAPRTQITGINLRAARKYGIVVSESAVENANEVLR